MKITHSSGEDYDLTPGLTLEIERTNPFFNDYGEQSLPVTLPATERNRRILSYPDDIRGLTKMSQRADATVAHGAYFMRCRQAVLSANKKDGIEMSFYLNTGAFYEKYQDVSLSTIFENRVITFNSVSEAISFCKGLYTNYDERLACFPVYLEDTVLNQFKTRGTGNNSVPDLLNSEASSIEVDGKTIALDPGYYITPFIRANYLLREVLAYLGYTLQSNFFTETEPFRSMVFLNNNIDTLMKSEIRFTQIIPDCMVSTLLDVYRNLFCCEFIPDEVNKTITIRLFDEILAEETLKDITPYHAATYTVDHPAKFRQLKLSATYVNKAKTITRVRSRSDSDTDQELETFNSLRELLIKYPDAEYDEKTGAFTRYGFRGLQSVSQIIGYLTCDYYAGGNLETFEAKADCTIPTTMLGKRYSGRTSEDYLSVYIGSGRSLNSTIVMDSDLTDDNTETVEADDATPEELPVMPCFVIRHSSDFYDQGTIMNYNNAGNRMFDYVLAPNGPDGFFERFWRNYDNLLRNSFLKVTVPLLLPDAEKLQLSEHKKVLFDGQELFPDVIRFVANKEEVSECDFLTTKLYTPLSTAMSEAERLPAKSIYEWVLKYTPHSPDPAKQRITFSDTPSVSFYAAPTAAQFYQGGRFYEKTVPAIFYSRTSSTGPFDPVDGTVTIWLEAALK